MMRPQNLTITLLLPLLLISFLACADNPTTPDTLTEEEIAALVDARVAEELAKMSAAEDDTLTPAEIATITLKSTVVLLIKKTDGSVERGSGFVIGEGKVATVFHILDDSVITESTVRLITETTRHRIQPTLTIDKAHDLAVIQTDVSAPALSLADSDRVQIGDAVYACGNPLGYIGTFSDGIVTGIRHDDPLVADKVFQINVAIALGSSGSPALNDQGQVIGVVQGNDTRGQNLGFMIPVNHLKALLKTIQ